MNLFDVILLLTCVAWAVGGYRLGFVARAASWLGLWLGMFGGALLLPVVLPEVQDASEATVTLVGIGLVVGMALVGNALGLVLGSQLHAELPPGAARRADQVAGGAIGVFGVLIALWVLLPILTSMPGWWATQVHGSVIAREVNAAFPDPPDGLAALRRVVGDDAFPQVFDTLRPTPDLGERGEHPECPLVAVEGVRPGRGELLLGPGQREVAGDEGEARLDIQVKQGHPPFGVDMKITDEPSGPKALSASAISVL